MQRDNGKKTEGIMIDEVELVMVISNNYRENIDYEALIRLSVKPLCYLFSAKLVEHKLCILCNKSLFHIMMKTISINFSG